MTESLLAIVVTVVVGLLVLVEDHFELGTALANALIAARQAPWHQVAEQFGLGVNGEASELAGAVDGRPVQVRHRSKKGTTGQTVIEIGLPDAPEGFTLRKRLGPGAGQPLGDPVLDLAVEVHGPADGLGSVFSDEETRDLALELVHGLGAVVEDGGVRLVGTGRMTSDLEARLKAVMRFAELLSAGFLRRAPASSSSSSEVRRVREPESVG